VSVKSDDLGTVRVPLPGHHNVLNTLAALATGLELGISFEDAAEACGRFEGVGRRFEVLGDRDGVTVVDDYAHHPTEVRAVLEAARQAMPERRVIAVFQPHLYSRTRDFAVAFAEALLTADVALVLPIYPARERPIEGVTSELIVESAARLGHPNATMVPSMEESFVVLSSQLRPGDVLITMGAGDVDRVAEKWLGGDS
jgi:UDP-N-acetylmuramate--alanine ligase